MKLDLRSLSQKERQNLFNQAFSLFKGGKSQKYIGQKLGIRIATVCEWFKVFKKTGNFELKKIKKPEKQRGKGSNLSRLESQSIKNYFKEKLVNSSSLLPVQEIKNHIKSTYNIDMPNRTIYDYVEKWDISLSNSLSNKYFGLKKTKIIKSPCILNNVFGATSYNSRLKVTNIAIDRQGARYFGRVLSQKDLDVLLSFLSEVDMVNDENICLSSLLNNSVMIKLSFSALNKKPLLVGRSIKSIIISLEKLKNGNIYIEQEGIFSLIDFYNICEKTISLSIKVSQNNFFEYFTRNILSYKYMSQRASLSSNTCKWMHFFIELHREIENQHYSISVEELHQLSKSRCKRLRHWKKNEANKALKELKTIGFLKSVYYPKSNLPYYSWELKQ